MNVALICPRSPRADGKGDAVRAHALLAALLGSHEVTVLAPGWVADDGSAPLKAPSRIERVGAALGDLAGARPGQVGWSTSPRAWAAVKRHVRGHDAAVVITVRALRGPLGIPTVLDHVDALSHNMRLRSKGREPWPLRRAAAWEAARLAAWEQRAAGWVDAQLAISADDASRLPSAPPPVVVPPAWDGMITTGGTRDVEVMFTGNMRYPPNREAALWMAETIAPEIRRRRPGTRVAIVGRDADRLGLRGVEVRANVPSIHDELMHAKVALVPLTGRGTGVPNKVLEAAGAGAAIVTTPWVKARLDVPAIVAEDAAGLASAAVELLAEEDRRAALAGAAAAELARYGVATLQARLDAILADVVAGRPQAS